MAVFSRMGRRRSFGVHVLAGLIPCAALLLSACSSDGSDTSGPLFKPLPPSHTGIDFVNEVQEEDGLNVVAFESFYNGAGVGVGDFDGDGQLDLFLASNLGASRLYRNEGDLRFRDATAEAGIHTRERWVNGVSIVDVDQDGAPDIYLSCGGPFAAAAQRANLLYVNNGDGTFSEKSHEYGLADTGITTHTAFFDYDRDGDLDAYLLTNGIGETGPNVVVPPKTDGQAVNTDRLYRNDGAAGFTDVSREANVVMEGYGLGIAVFDVNRDGWEDMYAANDYLSNDVLYVNNGDGTFTDRASEYFRHQSYASMGTDAADFNNDGLVDVVTVDMLPSSNRRMKLMYGDAGYERQRSELAAGYNRQLRRNTLQLNNGALPGESPSFSEIGHLAGVSSTGWSWSSLFADVDNDGWRDLMITNGLPRDVTHLDFGAYKMGQLRTRSYEPSMIEEFAETLAGIEPVSIRNYLFRNEKDLTFSDRSYEWGFRRNSFSTGAAFADLDDDGDLDLVINNVNDEAFLYENTLHEDTTSLSANSESASRVRRSRSFLKVRLEGSEPNRDGLGARVSVYANGLRQYTEHTVYRGYLSSTASDIHFGLAGAAAADSIKVDWPDGKHTAMYAVRSNQTVVVHHHDAADGGRDTAAEGSFRRTPDSKGEQDEPASTKTSSRGAGGSEEFPRQGPGPPQDRLFVEVSEVLQQPFVHRETHYNDFKLQPLLPHKFSQNGPGLAVGDVDGDGREDFYVGGAYGRPGRIYLQDASGTFRLSTDTTSLRTKASGDRYYEEDMGSLFFDADGDGRLDLYIVSGGSEFEAGSEYYQDRLYLGDGSGRFVQAESALPEMRESGSVVTAADLDGDGDLDLFVGGRVVPNAYPVVPRSFLLENRDGTFVDATETLAPGLRRAGLVTSALWSDFNDDGRPDLIVAGEWMPITFFENRGGRLVDVTEEVGMGESVGWWNSIISGDFDRDGDTDYVAGNLGYNTSLRVDKGAEVRAHVIDLNRDGRYEAVFSRSVDGREYPLHLRDDLIAASPPLTRRFPTYADYATASTAEVLGDKEPAAVLVVDTFASSYIENRGDEGFRLHELPVQAQVAPVFGLLSGDFDGDGAPDVLMTGNSYANEAFVGPYDAFNGLLLRGGPPFSAAPLYDSGFVVDGDGKSLAAVTGADADRLILAAQNDDRLRVFETVRAADTVGVRAGEVRAAIHHDDGSVEEVEFHRGSGYLSQSSSTIHLSEPAAAVRLFDMEGPTRTWRSGKSPVAAPAADRSGSRRRGDSGIR